MNAFTQVTKAILLAFYVLVPVSFLTPILAEHKQYLLIALIVILVAHVGEYIAMKSKMINAAPARNDHFLQTLLFGYAHWLPYLQKKTQP